MTISMTQLGAILCATCLTIATQATLQAAVSADVRWDWKVTERSRTTTVKKVRLSELPAHQRQQLGKGGQQTRSNKALSVAYAKMLTKMKERNPEMIDKLDENQDEQFSAAELSKILRSQAVPLIAHADLNKDQLLDWQEITKASSGSATQTDTKILAARGGLSSPGGRSHIFVGRQQAYIQDYDVVGDQYQPVVGTIGEGTVLDVANPFVVREIVVP